MADPETSPPWFILASRFHAVVVDRLIEGARSCLSGHGVTKRNMRIVRVAGAFELPQVAAACVAQGPQAPAGLIALGCVVRGETPHFDFVCQGATDGLMQVALSSRLPMGFGLLTCDTLEQALARAGGEHGDKGWEAAEAAWDLGHAIASLRSPEA